MTRVWSSTREETEKNIAENRLWWGLNGKNKVPAKKNFLSDIQQGMMPMSLWHYEMAGTNQDAKKESMKLFGKDPFDNPKPEKLLSLVMQIATQTNDLVLDSFLGSGTTAAVAHKMGRRYIGIEMGNHAYTHCKVRLDKVISGEDRGGITKSANWQGGGGYRFYELAPSLVVEDMLDFKASNPLKVLVNELRNKPEIDYDTYSDLLYDLLTSLIEYLGKKYTGDEIKNIVMYWKRGIADKIYAQMKKHFVSSTPDIIEQITGVSYTIYAPNIVKKSGEKSLSLYTVMDDDEVPKHVFTGFAKALHPEYKFDSNKERRLAIVCESCSEVIRWLRPAPKQFNLFYGNGQRYEPDFVVETADTMYLVEVKGEDRFDSEKNKAKKARAVRYCELATLYCEAHDLKMWKYLYIPAEQIQTNSSFNILAQRFEVKKEI